MKAYQNHHTVYRKDYSIFQHDWTNAISQISIVVFQNTATRLLCTNKSTARELTKRHVIQYRWGIDGGWSRDSFKWELDLSFQDGFQFPTLPHLMTFPSLSSARTEEIPFSRTTMQALDSAVRPPRASLHLPPLISVVAQPGSDQLPLGNTSPESWHVGGRYGNLREISLAS